MTEPTIIIAAIGLIASVIAALIASKAQTRSTSTALYAELCKGQQARIDQLTKRVVENEAQIESLQAELCSLREERERLEKRVAELERENASLRAQIEALEKRKGR